MSGGNYFREKFYSEGATIFGGNCPGVNCHEVGGGQFSSGTIFFGGNYPREQLSGGNHPGGNYPGGNYPVGSFPRGQLS